MIQNKANQEQFYVCQRGIPPTVTQSAAASSTAHDDYIPKANAEMFKGVKIMTVNMWAACASRTVFVECLLFFVALTIAFLPKWR